MILLLNVYLAPDAPWFFYDRGDLPAHSKFEVLEHTLNSYRALGFRKAYLNIEVDPVLRPLPTVEFEDPEPPGRPWLSRWTGAIRGQWHLSGRRACRQSQWQTLVDEVTSDLAHPNEPIWVAGNHDHPYIQLNGPRWSENIERLFKEGDPLTSVIYSHHAEFIDQAAIHGGQLVTLPHDGTPTFVKYQVNDVHSIRVVTPHILRSMWFDHDYGAETHLPRSDWWVGGGPFTDPPGHIPVKAPMYNSYVPLVELCRHFDGYTHIGVPNYITPPLTIPHRPDEISAYDQMGYVAHMHGRSVPEEWRRIWHP